MVQSKRVMTALVGGALAVLGPACAGHAAVLITHYDFDETAGPTVNAIDHGASPQLPGRFYGSATRTADTPGNRSEFALDLTAAGHGSVGSVDGANNPNDADKADTLSQMTITYWLNVKAAPAASAHVISGRTAPGAVDGDGWWNVGFAAFGGTINADRMRLAFGIGSNNNGANIVNVNSDGIGSDAGNGNPWDTSDNWLFIAITYDSTQTIANAVKFYIGDATTAPTALALGSAVGTPAAPTQNTTDLRVGIDARFNTDATREAPGYLDDVRIYSGLVPLSSGSELDLDDIRLAPLPEPASLLLLAAGGALLSWRRRRA